MPDFRQILIAPDREQLPVSLALWLGLAILGGLLAMAGWRCCRVGPLPPQRRRAVPWNGFALAAIGLIWQFGTSMVAGLLLDSGFFQRLYGPDFSYGRNGRPIGGTPDPIDSIRLGLWGSAIAFPLVIAAIVGFLLSAAGARAYQLGLTTARAGQNALLGFFACLAVLPTTYLVHTFALGFYQQWLDMPPEHHVLEELVQTGPSPVEWVLVIISAVILAPVLEELLFRGILQPWIALKSHNADIILGATLTLVLSRAFGSPVAAWIRTRSWTGTAADCQPVFFVLVMAGVYLVVRALERSPVPGAIFTSSLLFAATHSNWPTPIPLFVLALALGYLAYRTQSLVASMVLHALFNGFACALLVLGVD